tara:strand:+ start:187 stop:471 length:285 start_codon:yes stop_codon:yes gene_type:complete
MKYQNKWGISLNFNGKNTTSVLIKEVVEKAIEMLGDIPGQDLETLSGVNDTIEFLKENFDIDDEEKYIYETNPDTDEVYRRKFGDYDNREKINE